MGPAGPRIAGTPPEVIRVPQPVGIAVIVPTLRLALVPAVRQVAVAPLPLAMPTVALVGLPTVAMRVLGPVARLAPEPVGRRLPQVTASPCQPPWLAAVTAARAAARAGHRPVVLAVPAVLVRAAPVALAGLVLPSVMVARADQAVTAVAVTGRRAVLVLPVAPTSVSLVPLRVLLVRQARALLVLPAVTPVTVARAVMRVLPVTEQAVTRSRVPRATRIQVAPVAPAAAGSVVPVLAVPRVVGRVVPQVAGRRVLRRAAPGPVVPVQVMPRGTLPAELVALGIAAPVVLRRPRPRRAGRGPVLPRAVAPRRAVMAVLVGPRRAGLVGPGRAVALRQAGPQRAAPVVLGRRPAVTRPAGRLGRPRPPVGQLETVQPGAARRRPMVLPRTAAPRRAMAPWAQSGHRAEPVEPVGQVEPAEQAV